jgi:cysteine synthase A
MQGWAPDFIPKLTGDVMQAAWIDDVTAVPGQRALDMSKALARQEGIFVGISAGATLAGALDVAAQAPAGSNILCMLPDTGERYLSTPLFADIDVEMSEEEQSIARSTPNYRFDVRPVPAPENPAPETPPEVDPQAQDFVDDALAQAPVVLFALEWCEFCWSVRKLFQAAGIAYRSVDLDSAALQADSMGGRIRTELLRRTGMRTIPQVFVGGELIGGCTETFDTFEDGTLADRLAATGQPMPTDRGAIDPYTMLPGWLARRRAS